MNLTDMHKNYFNPKGPISAKQKIEPIIPIERWEIVNNELKKTYIFQSINYRNDFLNQVLTYEESTTHCAVLHIDENVVNVSLTTKNVNGVTELDKEHAAFCDLVFKDVIQRVYDE